jgi:hypothetical protein
MPDSASVQAAINQLVQLGALEVETIDGVPMVDKVGSVSFNCVLIFLVFAVARTVREIDAAR